MAIPSTCRRRGQLQIELTDGGAVSVIGPGALYAASLTPRDGKTPPLAELYLPRGWLKLDVKAPGMRLRIRFARRDGDGLRRGWRSFMQPATMWTCSSKPVP